MIQDCKFDLFSDVEEVVPSLAADVSEMMITHTVPATSSTDTPYTNETDIKEVGHYLRDTVDIAMAKIRLDRSLAEKFNKAGVQSTAAPAAAADA